MCCDMPEAVFVPPAVAEMLTEYRRLQSTSILDWGGEVPALIGAEYGRFLDLSQLWSEAAATGDWSEAVRRSVPEPLPRGMVRATINGSGVTSSTGPRVLLLPGMATEIGVLIDSRVDDDRSIAIAGRSWEVRAGTVRLVSVVIGHDDATVDVAGTPVSAGEPVEAARIRLRADRASRWSVLDERGSAWFPEGRLRKWDYHGRPFFHGNDLVVDVPARRLHVSCTRGMEFSPVVAELSPEAGRELVVELEPVRLYDAAARGWYGGDLHVHMNYSGDLVCSPRDAAVMQHGEALHLMNLVAGNLLGARIYDREAFEHFAGDDLPWSTEDQLVRWSVEFRNDLLGHFHAFAPTSPPTRYQTGHTGSAHPEDWPPNATACEDLRSRGATIGYTHPVLSPLRDGTPAEAFVSPRSTEARELVADAALGLVDSVDLIGPNDPEGTTVLYHHLLSCGLRLAATVGTDVFLSHSKSTIFSNPPGWGRVYANLNGERLSTTSWQQAIRSGRTFVTNGPWLELDVDGHGPGAVLDLEPGAALTVRAHVEGPGVETLELVGSEGTLVVAEGPDLRSEVVLDEPGWLAVVARGPGNANVLGPTLFAHTSPVYLDMSGRRVAKQHSAAWCLDWLDRVEGLAREHGTFSDDAQWRDLVGVLDEARRFYRSIGGPD